MLAIELSVNVLWLPFIILFSALAGFTLRSRQIKRSKRRILTLEDEMLNNHAEILKLQEQLAELQNNLVTGNKSKVVSMKDPVQDEKKDNPDLPERKRTIN